MTSLDGTGFEAELVDVRSRRQVWVRNGMGTKCQQGRGLGPTKSMGAPALRY
jgi:hypothetical protein